MKYHHLQNQAEFYIKTATNRLTEGYSLTIAAASEEYALKIDREEARIIRKIIKSMKRNMSPQRSESQLFLKTPRIFELQYIYGEGNTPHPFLNKFKPCACRNFSVNYTPDGSYMTYEGEPSMTSYQITMGFGEIEPIYADEYKDNNSPTTGF